MCLVGFFNPLVFQEIIFIGKDSNKMASQTSTIPQSFIMAPTPLELLIVILFIDLNLNIEALLLLFKVELSNLLLFTKKICLPSFSIG